ncbi:DUF6787 family protein [Flavobacterium rhizosphaerae]|uniref:DUF6787 family protein n=1 Tax=Flavobacterium rhizosphaerae TaxID=3163298 RepID=A0ABW8YXW6_9FLAO
MKKFKQRWGIKYNYQLVVIFIVFAVTGSTSAYVSKPILSFLHLSKDEISPWLYYPLYIILIFPVYQVLLLFFGFISGQIKFFWAFEKKMLRGLGFGFLFKENLQKK